MDAILAFDFVVLQWIQEHLRCAFLDAFMPKISFLGNHGEIWILAAVVLLCTKRYRKTGIFILLGLLIGLILGNGFIKNLVARQRPCWMNPEMSLLIPVPMDYSFPSGHTLSSFIAAFILAKTKKQFGFLAIPLACLMAFSRLYLYVHFPTDILGGIVLAAGIAFVTWKGKVWFDKVSTAGVQ